MGTKPTIERLEKRYLKDDVPDFRPGDKIRVHVRIREGEKERIQVFEGAVLARSGESSRETFTVRKVSNGISVERVFPVHSPSVERIEVVSFGRVRRAKLYYLRDRQGKAARIKTMRERRGGGKK
jgi:large subunit ribosomal protein L19